MEKMKFVMVCLVALLLVSSASAAVGRYHIGDTATYSYSLSATGPTVNSDTVFTERLCAAVLYYVPGYLEIDILEWSDWTECTNAAPYDVDYTVTFTESGAFIIGAVMIESVQEYVDGAWIVTKNWQPIGMAMDALTVTPPTPESLPPPTIEAMLG